MIQGSTIITVGILVIFIGFILIFAGTALQTTGKTSDALIKSGEWMSRDEIEEGIECPCPAQLCESQELDACIYDELDESLERFCKKNVLKSRKKNITQYYLKEEG